MVPNHQKHVPVLLEEVLTHLNPKPGETYLDLTAGYGGHAEAIVSKTKSSATLVDRDKNIIAFLKEQFKGKSVDILHSDFLSASRELEKAGKRYDMILADVGVSSQHLNTADRGFAINQEGPLDMRMDQSQTLTAAIIVNTYSEVELTDILRRYGEEPKARKIARLIVEHRPFKTTTELARIVTKVWRLGTSKVHPATRTFQALRIAVNDELAQLEQALPLWLDLLEPGGRIAVISFHSLEDGLVKHSFAEVSGDRYDANLKLLTKHPITAGKDEIVSNPRARSAKLRAAVKIKI